ncbi:MAG: hypothetical protein ACOC8N_07890, partial [Spirochaetota bacterium]
MTGPAAAPRRSFAAGLARLYRYAAAGLSRAARFLARRILRRPVLSCSAAAALVLLSLFWFALPGGGDELFEPGWST